MAGHDVVEPFKKDTPLDRFWRKGGYVVLLGVTHTANSLIHVAQELAEVPYLDRPKTVKVKNGTRLEDRIARRAGCSLGFDKIASFISNDTAVRRYKVAEANVLFMNAEIVLKNAVEILKENPYILSCENPLCFACNEMKEFEKKREKE